ncbi:MAG: hypothetical protein RMJ19_05510 [Gemmatales bacterium]|nr:hypothetical protein [Gemmatales bacterium]MCS7159911.1 hypothetical protein [Gemmatales bacterium]MDW8175110.1 hypothetical protein [Gemmatales bacterium]MDW8223350.1 hypothetical protein [Gemmatales bacterium]
MKAKKKVAAIVTEYRHNSHADVIVGKILEGFDHRGNGFPDLELVTMYVDQFPKNDMSRDLAKKHGFHLCKTIEEALTLGGNKLVVEGVLLIGEHGNYPFNEKGQHLYPRRRFFEATIAAFDRCQQVVPVFNDKHLAATWEDAHWMYEQARKRMIPFMAGSSLPVTWRKPPLTLPRGCELESVVALGYGPFESYGFHMLEMMQCMVERRKGFETGVRSVTCLTGPAMWQPFDQGLFPQALVDVGIELIPSHSKGDYRKAVAGNPEGGLFLVEYRDGLRAAAILMNGFAYEGFSGAFVFVCKLRGQDKPLASHFYLENRRPFGHFAYQLKAIEHMIHTGHPAYPVERTLLTTGILDAVMTSRFEKNKRIETPYLAIRYTPTDWPHAPDPAPPPHD